MLDLQGKTFIITGATGGIGSSLSEKLATAGAKLILLGRTSESVEKLRQYIGETHEFIVCDLSNRVSIKQLIVTLTNKPHIDGFIHIAGTGIYKNLLDITDHDWDRSFETHVTAPFLIIRSLLTKIQQSDVSLVLTLGTGAGVIPMRGRSVYCSSKFALRGLTLSLAEEYRGIKPHFCLITLGSTLTSFGGKSIIEKEKEFRAGRAYFPVDWVTNKLIEIIQTDTREIEYVLYPGDYGFGEWKKP